MFLNPVRSNQKIPITLDRTNVIAFFSFEIEAILVTVSISIWIHTVKRNVRPFTDVRVRRKVKYL